MRKWEYKTWELQMSGTEGRYVEEWLEIDRILNVFGKDGFELAAVLPVSERKSIAIFKRPVD